MFIFYQSLWDLYQAFVKYSQNLIESVMSSLLRVIWTWLPSVVAPVALSLEIIIWVAHLTVMKHNIIRCSLARVMWEMWSVGVLGLVILMLVVMVTSPAAALRSIIVMRWSIIRCILVVALVSVILIIWITSVVSPIVVSLVIVTRAMHLRCIIDKSWYWWRRSSIISILLAMTLALTVSVWSRIMPKKNERVSLNRWSWYYRQA